MVLSSPLIQKVGVSTKQDIILIQQQFDVNCDNVVDLSVLAPNLGFAKNAGTRRLCSGLLKVNIEKDKSVTVSDWSKYPLTTEQINYAAADAAIARKMALVMLPEIPQPILSTYYSEIISNKNKNKNGKNVFQ